MPIVPVSRGLAASPTIAPARVDPRPRVRPVVLKHDPAAATLSSPAAPEYQVGYKKPPLHTRFSKDRPGNRKGRPKGAKSLKTLIRELLTQKVKVRTAAGLQTMTKMEAMLHKILEQAFSGNLRALQSFIVLYREAVPDEPATPPSGQITPATIDNINEHDRAMLDELRATIAIELGDDQ